MSEPRVLTDINPMVLAGFHPSRHFSTRVTTTGAVTNGVVKDIGAEEVGVVTQVEATLSKGSSATKVAFRVGFHDTSTPTGDGVISAHAGLAPGGGVEKGNGGGTLAIGAPGQNILYDVEAPTAGQFDLVVSGLIFAKG